MVTAAVRDEMPKGTSAEFRNVRTDAQSGFVCGELMLEGRPQRFLGKVAGESAEARLEQQNDPEFDTRFARLCAGTWVLPQTR
jgi:hypothetical protein